MSNIVPKDSREISTNLSTKVEAALIEGDLSKMSPEEKLVHYKNVCESLGLNPHTKPFGYIPLKGKLTLYALRACTDQLRGLHGVSVVNTQTAVQGGIVTVTCTVRDKHGREDSDIGCVSLADARGEKLSGEELANAFMKAVTKAKRRATLSLCGLGWLDETEVENIKGAKPISATEAHQPKPNLVPALVEPEPQSNAKAPEVQAEENGKKMVTKNQLKAIGNLLKEINFSPAELENWKVHMREEYGVEKSVDLSFESAEALIADLQALTIPAN